MKKTKESAPSDADTSENKYDIRVINFARQKEPHFLSRSRDGAIIMRRGEDGSMMLFAHDQKTIVEMSAEDANDFALWILLTNARGVTDAPVRRFSSDDKSSLAHALDHLLANKIAEEDCRHSGWYRGNRAEFVARHKKAVVFIRTILSHNK